MANMISLRIDGELVRVEEGHTIFEAAESAGKPIPGLCQMKGLSPVGACRLCAVEVAGVNRLFPSCTTPAQDGMSVTTQSPRLKSYRRMVVELLLAARNHICAVCVSNNHCELQALSQKLGVTHVRYAYSYRPWPDRHVAPALRAGPRPLHPVRALHPRLRRDRRRPRVGHDVARRGLAPGV